MRSLLKSILCGFSEFVDQPVRRSSVNVIATEVGVAVGDFTFPYGCPTSGLHASKFPPPMSDNGEVSSTSFSKP